MIGTTSTSPYSAPPPALAAPLSDGDTVRRGSLRDITTVAFGNPNSLPGPTPSHFFPSVPKAKRDQQRAARLSSPLPPAPLKIAVPAASTQDADMNLVTDPSSVQPHQESTNGSPSSPSAGDDTEFEQRQRAAKFALASHGPFPSTSLSPFPSRSNPASVRDGSSTSATPTLKSVGGGGSQGTKRRYREAAERTDWDAASELVRIERERERVIDNWASEGSPPVGDGDSGLGRRPEASARIQTPGSPLGASANGLNGGMKRTNGTVSVPPESQAGSPQDVDMEEGEGEEDEFDEDDGASVATFKTGASTKSKAKVKTGTGEAEPAKKRSRTLTTPAQTAVLNALLAKTRFPSTETREEVGAQIGMSARRVQIWFQNRRQSQKRLRDREVQDPSVSSIPTNASTHSLPAGHAVPIHPHYPYGPPTSDPYAAHRYPAHGQVPPHFQQRYGAPSTVGSITSQAVAGSQVSLQQLQYRSDLSRQTSVDSLASRNSFVSAASAARGGRFEEGQGSLPSDARFGSPHAHAPSVPTTMGGSRVNPPPTTYQPHPSTTHRSSQIPSKLYFPHVTREYSAAPASRIRTESVTSTGSGAGDVKLPSLSALLNGTPSQPPYPRSTQASEHSTPPTRSEPPAFQRAIFSPPPSTSFERLRISGPTSPPPPPPQQIPMTSTSPFAFHPPPLQAQTSASQSSTSPMSPLRENSPDILDVAMDAMAYRPVGRSLPPRSTLPPLRSVLGESTFPSAKARPGSKTEADKLLMAPIAGPSSASLGSGPPRLAPISMAPLGVPPDLALSPVTRSSPLPPFSPSSYAHVASRVSVLSEAATAHTRSSRDHQGHTQQHGAEWHSNGSTATTSNGGGSSGSRGHRSSVGSSSRTSVSSK